jgi:hypothetical protein
MVDRRRGRPPKGVRRLQPVSTSVEPEVYAVLKRLAESNGLSVAAIARRVLAGRTQLFTRNIHSTDITP